MTSYATGNYVKNGRVRAASTAADAVDLVWNGYVPVADQPAPSRSDLQAQAKALGIPANQTSEALLAAIAEAPVAGTNVPGDAPEVADTTHSETVDSDRS